MFDWSPAILYPMLAAGGIAVAGLLLRGVRWVIAEVTTDVVAALDTRLGINAMRDAVATIQRELRPNGHGSSAGSSVKDQITAADTRDTTSTAATPKTATVNEDSSIVDLLWSLSTRIDHLDANITRRLGPARKGPPGSPTKGEGRGQDR